MAAWTAREHIARAQQILDADHREGELANNAWRLDAHLRIAKLLLENELSERITPVLAARADAE